MSRRWCLPCWLLTWSLLCGTGFGSEPYPASTVIDGLDLDWATHRRDALGSDNFQLTWADDGNLYGAWGDGGGFGGSNRNGRVGIGVARIEGSADQYRGMNVWGGFNAKQPARFDGKSWGMICVDGTLHMWVVPDRPDGVNHRNHYAFIELASSEDRGASWGKADWRFRQADGLTIPTFLNLGRNHEGAPSEFGHYVYSYFIRPQDSEMEQEGPDGVGLVVHKPGEIYLSRVVPSQIRTGRQVHEFYTGSDGEGRPMWGTLEQKRPVFRDSNGVGWCVSACYHPASRRVLLCTEHGQSKQGLLGIFDAPTPWGPWTIVEYFTPSRRFGAERPGSDLSWNDNVFFTSFPTKWFQGDRFTLSFTGAGNGKDNDSFNTVQGRFRMIR